MKSTFIPLFLLLSTIVFAQDFYDMDSIQTIEVTFAQSNWDQLMDIEAAGDGNYIMAESVTINGITFDSIGVKYKGNSSYRSTQVKNPWHIELDTYKDHEYDGYTDIKLANGYNDPSFLRDVIGYQVVRQYMDAPLANFANLYVNGQLIGLYSNTESISKKFMDSRFGTKNNTRFKCSPPDGAGPQATSLPNLVYLGEDSTDYYDAYELQSDEGWQELIDLCDTLANHTEDIDKMLDVDRALWMLAFHNVIVNLDSYIGLFKQNYYLYRTEYGQFLPIVWDLNESFGIFSQTGTTNLNNTASKQQMSHLLHENDSAFPLVQKLLEVPMYKRMYLAHYKTIMLENFDNGAYYDIGLRLQTVIDDAVRADNNKFFTYDNFISNLTTDTGGGGGGPGGNRAAVGIASLMDGRSDYILGQTDFTTTEPTISEPTISDEAPLLQDVITITTTIENAATVYLGYRNETIAPFTKVQMYDDGAHNDGAANDGVYGVDLTVTKTYYQYYIYAENDNIGMFSPRRAEYEYHEFNAAGAPAVGDIAINEFIASNDATAADQDGEFDDWIELYNNSTSAIDLSGYFLSDDELEPTQWSFPAGTEIAGNGYLIIWADSDEDQDGLHANFKLSGSGETIILSDANGTLSDLISYEDQTTDISFARIPNGTGEFVSTNPTFNAENILMRGLVINEFMASNDVTIADQDGEFEDWIELYNNSSTPIDLSGYFLSDDGDSLGLWRIPNGTEIAGNGYLVIWADDDEDQDGLHANFKLSSSGETIYLSSPGDTAIVDLVSYDQQTTDISYARLPNGTGNFDFATPTFSAENRMLTSTEEVLKTEDIILTAYPNPADAYFRLDISTEDQRERIVMIHDLTGKLIYQENVFESVQISTNNWPAGLYVIHIEGASMKILVQK